MHIIEMRKARARSRKYTVSSMLKKIKTCSTCAVKRIKSSFASAKNKLKNLPKMFSKLKKTIKCKK
jgi:hypothetical protein